MPTQPIQPSDQPQQHGAGGVDVADRFTAIKSTIPGLERGEPEPLFPGDIKWLVAEIERLRARCASLEAVAEAARGIALRQSPAHQALRQALAAINATTTQEGTHG